MERNLVTQIDFTLKELIKSCQRIDQQYEFRKWVWEKLYALILDNFHHNLTKPKKLNSKPFIVFFEENFKQEEILSWIEKDFYSDNFFYLVPKKSVNFRVIQIFLELISSETCSSFNILNDSNLVFIHSHQLLESKEISLNFYHMRSSKKQYLIEKLNSSIAPLEFEIINTIHTPSSNLKINNSISFLSPLLLKIVPEFKKSPPILDLCINPEFYKNTSLKVIINSICNISI